MRDIYRHLSIIFIILSSFVIQWNKIYNMNIFGFCSLSNLSCLKALYLGGNIFSNLPDVVCDLLMLERLDISNCGLSDLPER